MLFFFEHHGMEGGELFRVNKMRDQSFPAHLHRAYELIYVHAGKLRVQVEQCQYTMAAGDLAFLFCNQIHSFSSPGPSEISVVLFSPELVGDFYGAYRDCAPQSSVFGLGAPPDFAALQTVYAKKSFLYGMCDRLLAATAIVPVPSRTPVAVLQQILAFVDRRYGEECSLRHVAAELQYDYVYLSKLFTRYAGMHFTAYLNNYRIAQACYLLQNGGCAVAEVAARCGYATLRTFHRNFVQVMGCSPREYLAERGVGTAAGNTQSN